MTLILFYLCDVEKNSQTETHTWQGQQPTHLSDHTFNSLHFNFNSHLATHLAPFSPQKKRNKATSQYLISHLISSRNHDLCCIITWYIHTTHSALVVVVPHLAMASSVIFHKLWGQTLRVPPREKLCRYRGGDLNPVKVAFSTLTWCDTSCKYSSLLSMILRVRFLWRNIC